MTILDLFDIYLKVCSLANVQQGGQYRPQDFILDYNSVSNELFLSEIAMFQLNQIASDQLTIFLKTVNINVVSQPGKTYDLVLKPSDYEYLANLRVLRQKEEYISGYDTKYPIIDGSGNCTQVDDPDYAQMVANFAGNELIELRVDIIDNAKWQSALDSVRKGPTYDAPKGTQFDGGFKIAPKGLSSVVLDYFRTPRKAVFAYTIGAGDIIVYDPVASVQLEWTNTMENEFITRLLKKYAIRVRSGEVYQMGQNEQNQLV